MWDTVVKILFKYKIKCQGTDFLMLVQKVVWNRTISLSLWNLKQHDVMWNDIIVKWKKIIFTKRLVKLGTAFEQVHQW